MKNLKCLLLLLCSLYLGSLNAQVLKVENEYYEPELLMVSQPKMEFFYANDYDYVKLYFDVKNIGSETYKGDFLILLEPDIDHYYAKKRITVKPGKIKRIKLEIDLNQVYYDSTYTVMPVYEFDNQWYPLTMYEQFNTLSLHVNAPHTEMYIVNCEPDIVTFYDFDVRLHRPYIYGYYYTTPPVGWAYAYGYNPYYMPHYYVPAPIIVVNPQNPNPTPTPPGGNGNGNGGLHVSNPPRVPSVANSMNNRTNAPNVSSGNNRRPVATPRPSAVTPRNGNNGSQGVVNRQNTQSQSSSGSVRPSSSTSSSSGSVRPSSGTGSSSG
ncbi:MAG: hypothetical protein ACI358_08280, partial [Candidatus Limimorpha sp.]